MTGLVLLAIAYPLGAQEPIRRPTVLPAPEPSNAERLFSSRACGEYRLIVVDSADCSSDSGPVATSTDLRVSLSQAPAERPATADVRQPNHLMGGLVVAADLSLTLVNALAGYSHRSFHVNNEGFFGINTRDGGADKASHLTDYYVISKELAFVYQRLGYSEDEARWWGFGVAVVGGLVNEIGDGFTHHGFSPEDFTMDFVGASAAWLVSKTKTQDLFGMRTSHIPGSTYAHDVYSADLSLHGVAKRLGINIGPLRWLLFSVTYGAKGYRDSASPDQKQRQIGLEIGLNLQQILDDVKVTRDTWWGYALHMVADNVRFPYTAVGWRYDLNHGKWSGPNNGNY